MGQSGYVFFTVKFKKHMNTAELLANDEFAIKKYNDQATHFSDNFTKSIRYRVFLYYGKCIKLDSVPLEMYFTSFLKLMSWPLQYFEVDDLDVFAHLKTGVSRKYCN